VRRKGGVGGVYRNKLFEKLVLKIAAFLTRTNKAAQKSFTQNMLYESKNREKKKIA
jgi:hypothetical protein